MKEKNYIIEKIKTMHFIAILVVVFFLLIVAYQTYEVNVQLSKDLITSDIYERVIRTMIRDVVSIVMIVVMYFFGREIGKKEGEKDT